ncbi:pyrroline-5-carboxylate reductase [Stenotrophomonas sp. NLF4-10]|uniref:pyrroline-5-carboxylate reductase n=1 Tax=Stenotrophomonas sp. NLF4-10 TaxID=2918754 RepID=UPI0031F2EA51
MTSPAEVAFVGGGHMARCLVQGLLAEGRDPARIVVADPDADTRRALSAGLQVQATAHNTEAAAAAPVWVLAVKPQVAAMVCEALAPVAAQVRPLVISIMAGITHAQLRQWLGIDSVVRSMPNQPAAIGAGVTGLYAAPSLDAAQRASAESVFRGAGMTVWLRDEAQMDTVTAVAGSGPAYLYLLAEAMEQAARARDLPAETARRLVVQTLLGAARMLQAADEAPARLRERVTSPGGTTQAAVQVLEEGGWMVQVDRAIDAARARGQALAG